MCRKSIQVCIPWWFLYWEKLYTLYYVVRLPVIVLSNIKFRIWVNYIGYFLKIEFYLFEALSVFNAHYSLNSNFAIFCIPRTNYSTSVYRAFSESTSTSNNGILSTRQDQICFICLHAELNRLDQVTSPQLSRVNFNIRGT